MRLTDIHDWWKELKKQLKYKIDLLQFRDTSMYETADYITVVTT